MEQNYITEIPAKAFANYRRLRRIDLSNNNISKIAHDAFSGLKTLNSLVLYGNKIKELPAGVFKGLTSLQLLLLNANEISCIRKDSFRDLSSLSLLSLYDNNIQSLPNGTFDSLRQIQTMWVFPSQTSQLNNEKNIEFSFLFFFSFFIFSTSTDILLEIPSSVIAAYVGLRIIYTKIQLKRVEQNVKLLRRCIEGRSSHCAKKNWNVSWMKKKNFQIAWNEKIIFIFLFLLLFSYHLKKKQAHLMITTANLMLNVVQKLWNVPLVVSVKKRLSIARIAAWKKFRVIFHSTRQNCKRFFNSSSCHNQENIKKKGFKFLTKYFYPSSFSCKYLVFSMIINLVVFDRMDFLEGYQI
jgi:hypothetical protein